MRTAGGRPAKTGKQGRRAGWRLPSGQALAEFAASAGLVARRLIGPVWKSAARRDRAGTRASEWTEDSSPY